MWVFYSISMTFVVITVLVLGVRLPAPRVGWLTVGVSCLAWLTGLSVVALVPLDATSAVQGVKLAPLVPLWLASYWSTQVLTWAIIPVMQQYQFAPGFTLWRRLGGALKRLWVWYLVVGCLGGGAVAVALGLGTLSLSTLPALGATLSNAYGLVVVAASLGYGLVSLPRTLWRAGFPESEAPWRCHLLGRAAGDVAAASRELQAALSVAVLARASAPTRGPSELRVRADLLLAHLSAACPVPLRAISHAKPDVAALNEADLDLIADLDGIARLRVRVDLAAARFEGAAAKYYARARDAIRASARVESRRRRTYDHAPDVGSRAPRLSMSANGGGGGAAGAPGTGALASGRSSAPDLRAGSLGAGPPSAGLPLPGARAGAGGKGPSLGRRDGGRADGGRRPPHRVSSEPDDTASLNPSRGAGGLYSDGTWAGDPEGGGDAGAAGTSGAAFHERHPRLASFSWGFECLALPWLVRLAALVALAASLTVLWCEATIGFGRDPDLSPFSLLVHGGARGSELGEQFLVALPLAYMCWASYSSLLRLGFYRGYSIVPGATWPYSLLLSGGLLCRFAPPLCYNFLHVIRMTGTEGADGSVDPGADESRAMVFSAKMGALLQDVPILGVSFNKWFPVCLVVYVALLSVGLWERIMSRVFVASRLRFDADRADDEHTREGQRLVAAERAALARGWILGDGLGLFGVGSRGLGEGSAPPGAEDDGADAGAAWADAGVHASSEAHASHRPASPGVRGAAAVAGPPASRSGVRLGVGLHANVPRDGLPAGTSSRSGSAPRDDSPPRLAEWERERLRRQERERAAASAAAARAAQLAPAPPAPAAGVGAQVGALGRSVWGGLASKWGRASEAGGAGGGEEVGVIVGGGAGGFGGSGFSAGSSLGSQAAAAGRVTPSRLLEMGRAPGPPPSSSGDWEGRGISGPGWPADPPPGSSEDRLEALFGGIRGGRSSTDRLGQNPVAPPSAASPEPPAQGRAAWWRRS